MRILGFQKLTLLDYPGRVACTVFTGGCNLRCPFCHNSPLVLDSGGQEYTEEEIFSVLNKRRGVLDGVALTGGEPLIYPDVADFLARVKALGYSVKLDTNGFFPERLRELVEKGLCDYIALDVKNSQERYGETVGVMGIDLAPIKESVSYLLGGSADYEFRTTVVRELHTRESLLSLAEWIRGAKRWYLQAFVDSGAILAPGMSGYEKEELLKLAAAVRPIVPSVELRGI